MNRIERFRAWRSQSVGKPVVNGRNGLTLRETPRCQRSLCQVKSRGWQESHACHEKIRARQYATLCPHRCNRAVTWITCEAKQPRQFCTAAKNPKSFPCTANDQNARVLRASSFNGKPKASALVGNAVAFGRNQDRLAFISVD
jgi:hypothetical protein